MLHPKRHLGISDPSEGAFRLVLRTSKPCTGCTDVADHLASQPPNSPIWPPPTLSVELSAVSTLASSAISEFGLQVCNRWSWWLPKKEQCLLFSHLTIGITEYRVLYNFLFLLNASFVLMFFYIIKNVRLLPANQVMHIIKKHKHKHTFQYIQQPILTTSNTTKHKYSFIKHLQTFRNATTQIAAKSMHHTTKKKTNILYNTIGANICGIDNSL